MVNIIQNSTNDLYAKLLKESQLIDVNVYDSKLEITNQTNKQTF